MLNNIKNTNKDTDITMPTPLKSVFSFAARHLNNGAYYLGFSRFYKEKNGSLRTEYAEQTQRKSTSYQKQPRGTGQSICFRVQKNDTGAYDVCKETTSYDTVQVRPKHDEFASGRTYKLEANMVIESIIHKDNLSLKDAKRIASANVTLAFTHLNKDSRNPLTSAYIERYLPRTAPRTLQVA